MTLSAAHFLYEQKPNGVGVVSLNRPDRINALTFDIYRKLEAFFRKLSDEATVRAVVLRGEGVRGFCSGGDVRDIIGQLFFARHGWSPRVHPYDRRARACNTHLLKASHRGTSRGRCWRGRRDGTCVRCTHRDA